MPTERTLPLQAKAQSFVNFWKHQTDERREKDTFWNEFFAVFGIDRKRHVSFEYPVKDPLDNTQFVDVFWNKIFLGEHKSAHKNLDKAKEQAERYLGEIERTSPENLPAYYAVCDFVHFHLYRRIPEENQENEWKFPLEELPEYINRGVFNFMTGIQDKIREIQSEANIKAAEIIGKLHNALKEEGIYEEHELRLLITRLLFLFFADDSAVFQKNFLFQDLIDSHKHRIDSLGETLRDLFELLNTPENRRTKRQTERFAGFDYVNGGLFGENLRTFEFNSKQYQALVSCCSFDWRNISPEIFGTLFQSVMDDAERREHGAHYTEADNIEKVINGLFLEQLRQEFDGICRLKRDKAKKLADFYQKIRSLQFLDPACGCGNFLIVAYDHLRALEDDLIAEAMQTEVSDGLFDSPAVQCHLNQFHGIEIDEFASLIARVAMWLKNHQCNLRTQIRFEGKVACRTLPLQDAAQIIHANSLRIDWPQADYIFGNPPFIGHQWRSEAQQQDCERIFPQEGKFGKMDYVANWHIKAARQMLAAPNVQTAFVSTNSICQGEQAGILWKWLFEQGFVIRFAHRTFQWTSQAKGKAAVHCVIVGFGLERPSETFLFDYPDIKGAPVKTTVANINQYLAAGASVILDSRAQPPKGMVKMTKGSQATDGGNLILTPSEKTTLESKYPILISYIKPFIGAEELINGKQRYCLWFAGAKASDMAQIDKIPEIKERKEAIRTLRLASPTASVKEQADTPYLFTQNRQPKSNFLAMPEVSSERRRYIPMDFLSAENVPSNKIYMAADVDEYLFGLLTSEMHMAWMRTVAGRLESRYSYTPNVYHSFPFPEADDKQKADIIKLAQNVLAERRKQQQQDPQATLAVLYNPGTMPPELRQAHKKLDAAVDKLYRKEKFQSEAERVGFLFDLYAAKQAEAAQADKPKKSRKKAP